MKKLLLFLILHSSFLIVNCYSQQYGWVDISNNLPASNGTVTLPDMHWISDNEGWICSGLLGEIYHTADGGQTFETQTTQYYTNAIDMLKSQVGYAGGKEGRVYKTTNGGSDWIVHGSIGLSLRDIDFPPNSDSGYCCGDQGKIYKITSTGISSMTSGITSNLLSISFPSSGLGWTCGSSIILNYNGIWSQQDPPGGEAYNTIYMINNNTGWSVGANGVIVNTTDGGLSWNYLANPDTTNRTLLDVFFLNEYEGWAVGFNGIILYTTNSGANWNIEIDGWTNNMLRSVQFTSSTNGYILGNNKTLFKYGLLTDVEQQPTQPTEFKLEQNYPNPFNPVTTIRYTIPTSPLNPSPYQGEGNRERSVTLKVYDVLGNEVATLVDEYKPSGTYEVQFIVAQDSRPAISSGVYYYQLQAGDYLETKKMILLR